MEQMTKESVEKQIAHIHAQLEYCNANYHILYSKRYKLERNRAKHADARIDRYKRMLAFYNKMLVEYFT